jgi:hypothetical protein
MTIHSTNKQAGLGVSLIIVLIVVLLGAGLLQTQQLAAQNNEPPQGLLDEGLEPVAPEATIVSGVVDHSLAAQPSQPGQTQLYLPLLRGGPQFTALFATEVDENLNPIAPVTEFPRGTRQVYAVIGLNSVAGQRWSTQWYRNNLRIPGLVANGTVPADQQQARIVRRLSYANNGTLPDGIYKIVVSINDRPAFEATLRILP